MTNSVQKGIATKRATNETAASVLSGATTPRPWHVARTKFHGVPDGVNYVTIHGSALSVCKMTCSNGMQIEDVPDAALIVRAVNNHHALVKALEASRTQLITLGGDARPVTTFGDTTTDKIQAAVLDLIDAALDSVAEAS